MNKKLLTLAVTAGLAIGLAAVPASAAGNGSTINSSCLGATYGQLVSGARQDGHISGGVSGARSFVDSGLLAAHEAALCE